MAHNCKACGIDKEQEEKREKTNLALYLLSIIFFGIGFLPMVEKYQVIFYLISVLLAGYDLLIDGIKNIFRFNFEENTLMTIAIIAAFVLGEFPESCLVILLYKLGEMIEDKAQERSQSNIEEIVSIKAENANLIVKEETKVVPVEEVKVGDIIFIKPGEKVPVDSIVIKGNSSLDTSSLTGESKESVVQEGDTILSGSINLNGSLTAKVIRDSKNSTASQIVDLVYQATNNKGKAEKFITKFSKIYTPVVIFIAVMIAICPPLLGFLDFKTWVLRALVFLVASCPCSIVISVPLALFSCIGTISKKGMIIKGTKHIESLSKIDTIAFDKTGTLTTGKMVIKEMKDLNGFDSKKVLNHIYSLEKNSNHPISTAISKLSETVEEKQVQNYLEIPGFGIVGEIDGKENLLGNLKLLEKYQISTKGLEQDKIYLVIDKQIAGYFQLQEEIRPEAKTIVKNLKENGIEHVVMLTGDNKKQAEKIAKELEILEVYASLLPNEKLEKIEELKTKGRKVCFVGDGINDSPVLAASDFGIAMGAGAEIAAISADGVLISNNILKIPNSIKIAKQTMNILKTNIIFSLIMKAIVLVLGSMGIAPVWSAVLADVGVTLLTVLNSIRIFKK